MPLRYSFPICQKAEHERLKTTEDDRYRYRQRDRSKKPCSHLTSTANRFLLDQNIAWNPIFSSFQIQCRERRGEKNSCVDTVLSPRCTLIKELGCLYSRWSPCLGGGPIPDHQQDVSSEGSKCLEVCVCVCLYEAERHLYRAAKERISHSRRGPARSVPS